MERTLEFTLNSESAKKPTKAYAGDAGWDLYTSQRIKIPPHSFVDVPVDVSVAMPPGIWGLIIGRSSTTRKHLLRVELGVIDNGYRGELFVGVWNLSDNVTVVEQHTRLAQFILYSLIPVDWKRVEKLSESLRGANAFGSSGE